MAKQIQQARPSQLHRPGLAKDLESRRGVR
jgi:hypothetical protein